MITVNDLITKLVAYTDEHPLNGSRRVYMRLDGETCMGFGSAVGGDGLPGQSYLILLPDVRDCFKMRDARLAS